MGVDKPNYTQIPNFFLDDLMMHMSEGELKVTLAIARQTFGYHREKIKLSLTSLRQLTGLSRPTVVAGITDGVERGTIERTECEGTFVYSLCLNSDDQPSKESLLVKNLYQSASKDSLPGVVKNVYQPSKESLPDLVKNVYQNTPVLKKVLKKDIKESIKETPTARARNVDVHPNTRPILDAYVEALGYKPNNYGQESAGAKQLAQKGYEPSDVVAAYQFLKQEKFWQTKHLSLQTILKEIPALKHALLNGNSLTHPPANGNGYMNKGEKQNAAVDEAFRILEERERLQQ